MHTDTFAGKTQAHILAQTQDIVRVWDDTPTTAIVPATDAQGRRFEFVFHEARKALFDAHTRPLVAQGGVALRAVGYWNKRMWKKTKTTNGWGHTWQFVVAQWHHEGADNQPQGDVPTTMLPPAAIDARDAA